MESQKGAVLSTEAEASTFYCEDPGALSTDEGTLEAVPLFFGWLGLASCCCL